jgi:hypothetical protein
MAVKTFDQETLGKATEIDFSCPMCNLSKTAAALQLDYKVQRKQTSLPSCKQGVDHYELNWRLIMATELLTESMGLVIL